MSQRACCCPFLLHNTKNCPERPSPIVPGSFIITLNRNGDGFALLDAKAHDCHETKRLRKRLTLPKQAGMHSVHRIF
jgi:hypothetical protein